MNSQNLVFVALFIIHTVIQNHALVEVPKVNSNGEVLSKILKLFNEANSDERLFNVTLKLLKSLCVCMRESLKSKEKYFNGEAKVLIEHYTENVAILEDLYNKTCLNLKKEASNDIINFNDISAKRNIYTTKNDLIYDKILHEKLNDNSENFKGINNDHKNSFDILYKLLIETKIYHKYRLRKYSILRKLENNNNLEETSIVIITLYPEINKNSWFGNDSRTITENEIINTLLKNSPIDIDVIDTNFEKLNGQLTNLFPVSDCVLQSIYAFLIDKLRQNKIKTIKFLRKKNTIKIYINFFIENNHKDYTKICCTNFGIGICKLIAKEEVKSNVPNQIENNNYLIGKVNNDIDYKQTILKIKNLFKIYDEQVNEKSNTVLNDEKTDKENSESTCSTNLDLGFKSIIKENLEDKIMSASSSYDNIVPVIVPKEYPHFQNNSYNFTSWRTLLPGHTFVPTTKLNSLPFQNINTEKVDTQKTNNIFRIYNEEYKMEEFSYTHMNGTNLVTLPPNNDQKNVTTFGDYIALSPNYNDSYILQNKLENKTSDYYKIHQSSLENTKSNNLTEIPITYKTDSKLTNYTDVKLDVTSKLLVNSTNPSIFKINSSDIISNPVINKYEIENTIDFFPELEASSFKFDNYNISYPIKFDSEKSNTTLDSTGNNKQQNTTQNITVYIEYRTEPEIGVSVTTDIFINNSDSDTDNLIFPRMTEKVVTLTEDRSNGFKDVGRVDPLPLFTAGYDNLNMGKSTTPISYFETVTGISGSGKTLSIFDTTLGKSKNNILQTNTKITTPDLFKRTRNNAFVLNANNIKASLFNSTLRIFRSSNNLDTTEIPLKKVFFYKLNKLHNPYNKTKKILTEYKTIDETANKPTSQIENTLLYTLNTTRKPFRNIVLISDEMQSKHIIDASKTNSSITTFINDVIQTTTDVKEVLKVLNSTRDWYLSNNSLRTTPAITQKSKSNYYTTLDDFSLSVSQDLTNNIKYPVTEYTTEAKSRFKYLSENESMIRHMDTKINRILNTSRFPLLSDKTQPVKNETRTTLKSKSTDELHLMENPKLFSKKITTTNDVNYTKQFNKIRVSMNVENLNNETDSKSKLIVDKHIFNVIERNVSENKNNLEYVRQRFVSDEPLIRRTITSSQTGDFLSTIPYRNDVKVSHDKSSLWDIWENTSTNKYNTSLLSFTTSQKDQNYKFNSINYTNMQLKTPETGILPVSHRITKHKIETKDKKILKQDSKVQHASLMEHTISKLKMQNNTVVQNIPTQNQNVTKNNIYKTKDIRGINASLYEISTSTSESNDNLMTSTNLNETKITNSNPEIYLSRLLKPAVGTDSNRRTTLHTGHTVPITGSKYTIRVTKVRMVGQNNYTNDPVSSKKRAETTPMNSLVIDQKVDFKVHWCTDLDVNSTTTKSSIERFQAKLNTTPSRSESREEIRTYDLNPLQTMTTKTHKIKSINTNFFTKTYRNESGTETTNKQIIFNKISTFSGDKIYNTSNIKTTNPSMDFVTKSINRFDYIKGLTNATRSTGTYKEILQQTTKMDHIYETLINTDINWANSIALPKTTPIIFKTQRGILRQIAETSSITNQIQVPPVQTLNNQNILQADTILKNLQISHTSLLLPKISTTERVTNSVTMNLNNRQYSYQKLDIQNITEHDNNVSNKSRRDNSLYKKTERNSENSDRNYKTTVNFEKVINNFHTKLMNSRRSVSIVENVTDNSKSYRNDISHKRGTIFSLNKKINIHNKITILKNNTDQKSKNLHSSTVPVWLNTLKFHRMENMHSEERGILKQTAETSSITNQIQVPPIQTLNNQNILQADTILKNLQISQTSPLLPKISTTERVTNSVTMNLNNRQYSYQKLDIQNITEHDNNVSNKSRRDNSLYKKTERISENSDRNYKTTVNFVKVINKFHTKLMDSRRSVTIAENVTDNSKSYGNVILHKKSTIVPSNKKINITTTTLKNNINQKPKNLHSSTLPVWLNTLKLHKIGNMYSKEKRNPLKQLPVNKNNEFNDYLKLFKGSNILVTNHSDLNDHSPTKPTTINPLTENTNALIPTVLSLYDHHILTSVLDENNTNLKNLIKYTILNDKNINVTTPTTFFKLIKNNTFKINEGNHISIKERKKPQKLLFNDPISASKQIFSQMEKPINVMNTNNHIIHISNTTEDNHESSLLALHMTTYPSVKRKKGNNISLINVYLQRTTSQKTSFNNYVNVNNKSALSNTTGCNILKINYTVPDSFLNYTDTTNNYYTATVVRQYDNKTKHHVDHSVQSITDNKTRLMKFPTSIYSIIGEKGINRLGKPNVIEYSLIKKDTEVKKYTNIFNQIMNKENFSERVNNHLNIHGFRSHDSFPSNIIKPLKINDNFQHSTLVYLDLKHITQNNQNNIKHENLNQSPNISSPLRNTSKKNMLIQLKHPLNKINNHHHKNESKIQDTKSYVNIQKQGLFKNDFNSEAKYHSDNLTTQKFNHNNKYTETVTYHATTSEISSKWKINDDTSTNHLFTTQQMPSSLFSNISFLYGKLQNIFFQKIHLTTDLSYQNSIIPDRMQRPSTHNQNNYGKNINGVKHSRTDDIKFENDGYFKTFKIVPHRDKFTTPLNIYEIKLKTSNEFTNKFKFDTSKELNMIRPISTTVAPIQEKNLLKKKNVNEEYLPITKSRTLSFDEYKIPEYTRKIFPSKPNSDEIGNNVIRLSTTSLISRPSRPYFTVNQETKPQVLENTITHSSFLDKNTYFTTAMTPFKYFLKNRIHSNQRNATKPQYITQKRKTTYVNLNDSNFRFEKKTEKRNTETPLTISPSILMEIANHKTKEHITHPSNLFKIDAKILSHTRTKLTKIHINATTHNPNVTRLPDSLILLNSTPPFTGLPISSTPGHHKYSLTPSYHHLKISKLSHVPKYSVNTPSYKEFEPISNFSITQKVTNEKSSSKNHYKPIFTIVTTETWNKPHDPRTSIKINSNNRRSTDKIYKPTIRNNGFTSKILTAKVNNTLLPLNLDQGPNTELIVLSKNPDNAKGMEFKQKFNTETTIENNTIDYNKFQLYSKLHSSDLPSTESYIIIKNSYPASLKNKNDTPMYKTSDQFSNSFVTQDMEDTNGKPSKNHLPMFSLTTTKIRNVQHGSHSSVNITIKKSFEEVTEQNYTLTKGDNDSTSKMVPEEVTLFPIILDTSNRILKPEIKKQLKNKAMVGNVTVDYKFLFPSKLKSINYSTTESYTSNVVVNTFSKPLITKDAKLKPTAKHTTKSTINLNFKKHITVITSESNATVKYARINENYTNNNESQLLNGTKIVYSVTQKFKPHHHDIPLPSVYSPKNLTSQKDSYLTVPTKNKQQTKLKEPINVVIKFSTPKIELITNQNFNNKLKDIISKSNNKKLSINVEQQNSSSIKGLSSNFPISSTAVGRQKLTTDLKPYPYSKKNKKEDLTRGTTRIISRRISSPKYLKESFQNKIKNRLVSEKITSYTTSKIHSFDFHNSTITNFKNNLETKNIDNTMNSSKGTKEHYYHGTQYYTTKPYDFKQTSRVIKTINQKTYKYTIKNVNYNSFELTDIKNNKKIENNSLFIPNHIHLNDQIKDKRSKFINPDVKKFQVISDKPRENKHVTVRSQLTTVRIKPIKYNTYMPTKDDLDISIDQLSNKLRVKKKGSIIQKLKVHKNLQKYKSINYHPTHVTGAKITRTTHHLMSSTPSLKKYKIEQKQYRNFRKSDTNSDTLLDPFGKTNLYPIRMIPPQTRKKILKRIRIAKKYQDVMTIKPKEYLSQNLFATHKNIFKDVPVLHRQPLQNDFHVTSESRRYFHRPETEEIKQNNQNKEYFRPKPLLISNDDFYKEDFTGHHKSGFTWRDKVTFVREAIVPPVTEQEEKASVIERPEYSQPLPTLNKPKYLRDRIDSIRSYLNMVDIMPTRKPVNNYFMKSVSSGSEDLQSKESAKYYVMHESWVDHQTTSTTKATLKYRKRSRRTLFFLSPTVPYNRYF